MSHCGPSVLIMHDCHLAIMHANPGIAGPLRARTALRQNHLHWSWRFYLFYLFPSPGRSVMSLYIYPVIRPGGAEQQQTYQKLKIVPTTIVSVTSDKLQQCQIFEGIYTPISRPQYRPRTQDNTYSRARLRSKVYLDCPAITASQQSVTPG